MWLKTFSEVSLFKKSSSAAGCLWKNPVKRDMLQSDNVVNNYTGSTREVCSKSGLQSGKKCRLEKQIRGNWGKKLALGEKIFSFANK